MEEKRLAEMERNEPKRRLISDAKVLAKIRKITQARMAEEVGVPHRTLEEWLQFRRIPKAPGTTLLQRWVDAHQEGYVTCRKANR
jgi:DNA-binding transcriptional regulator YiaG